MSNKAKLFAGILFVIALIGGQAVHSSSDLREMGRMTNALLDNQITALSFARSAQTSFHRASRDMTRAMTVSQHFGSSAELEPIDAAFSEFLSDLDTVRKRAPSYAVAASLSSVQRMATEWKAQSDALLGAPSGNQAPVTSVPMPDSVMALGEDIDKELSILVDYVAADGLASLERSDKRIVATVETSLAVGIVGILAVMLFAFFMSRQAIRPAQT